MTTFPGELSTSTITFDAYPTYPYQVSGSTTSFELIVNGVGAGDYSKVSNWTVATNGSTIDCGTMGGYPSYSSSPPSATTGQVMFWTESLNYGNIAVSVDGSSKGSITTTSATTPPSCGGAGGLTVTLSPGSHSYQAVDNLGPWTGSINITAGGCSTMHLIP